VGGRWVRDLVRMERSVSATVELSLSSLELSLWRRAVVRKVGDVTQALIRWAEKERCSPGPRVSQ